MEIIVVDDGSTDSTAAVAAEAGVRYLVQRNSGPAAARDAGWRSATGEFIVFMDDDVVPERDAVVELVRALEHADGVGAVVLPLDNTSLVSHYIHVDAIVDHKVVDGSVQWLITAAAAFRREALERVDGFDLSFRPAGEDVDLSLRLVEAGCVLRVEPAARVRHHHRASLRNLVGMSHRYGSAYRALAARHAAHRDIRRRSAVLRFSPGEWTRMYAAYRREAPALRSMMFLGLHAMVVVPYTVGVLTSRRSKAGVRVFEAVELIGRSQHAFGHGRVEPMLVTEQVARVSDAASPVASSPAA
jgi:GT2 family glycosyltransferase